jgi:HD-GYP domain-containing protein (c-di-GMP phosphodiesterase class II)
MCGDKTLHSHSERVAMASLRLGRRIGLSSSQLHSLHLAALLHDCGKLALDPKVLNKHNPLNEEEWAQIKTHPRRGESLLLRLPFVRDALPGVRFHHERWDGSGYPDGLKGEEIPLAARIIGLCDAFDAMTQMRPYHAPMSIEFARDIVRKESGSHFDPMLVSAFLAPKTAATLLFSSHPTRVTARAFA